MPFLKSYWKEWKDERKLFLPIKLKRKTTTLVLPHTSDEYIN